MCLDYVCSNSNLQGGYLYVTPQFLVFDTAIHLFWKSVDSVKQTIPILLIESLNKVNNDWVVFCLLLLV